MVKVLVLYYSMNGSTEKMAEAVANGTNQISGVQTTILHADKVSVDELPEYDCIIIGTPVYFGTVAAEIKALIDKSGKLQGKLVGKVCGAFASAGQFGGGSETAVIDILKSMLCHGMIVQGDTFGNHFGAVSVGLPDDNARSECVKMGKRLAELTKRIFEINL